MTPRMILARRFDGAASDLGLVFARLGLPTAARDYLLEKIPPCQLLLTGLSKVDMRFLRGLFERSTAPGREEFPELVVGDAQREGAALLTGRLEQHRHVVAEARKDPDTSELARAIDAVIELAAPAPLTLGRKTFEWGTRTHVMGVVNVTPDSFSDGGRYATADAAIQRALQLVNAGADIIDVGGESTRPGAAAVSIEEELSRVLPVIRGLRDRIDTPISIDTTKSVVAAEALYAGASLVNDVSGLQFDPKIAQAIAQQKAACCVMHIQGTPRTMQEDPRYGDVVEEIIASLREAIQRAVDAGVSRERVLVDPGIGFGKTPGHNLFLLRRLSDFRQLGCPILVGTSRKSFLAKLTGNKPTDARLAATIGSVAALEGADIVRVHDVAEVKDALTVSDAIRRASEGGSLYERIKRSDT